MFKINELQLLTMNDLLVLVYLQDNTVTATASILELTQPTISLKIKKMEAIFNRKIVERHGKTIRLTNFGLAKAKYATDAVRTLGGV